VKNVHSAPRSQTQHPDALASAWDSFPRVTRQAFLACAGVPERWALPCSDSRWAYLPVDVQRQLATLLPDQIVQRASAELKARERE
jgi:hypothetical protein